MRLGDRRDYIGEFKNVIKDVNEQLREEGLPLLRTQRIVCPTCGGMGKHVNPSIDAHGITEDEYSQWDYDERDAYWSGAYDVRCNECGGENVVDDVGKEDNDPRSYEVFENRIESIYDYIAEREAERRMGC